MSEIFVVAQEVKTGLGEFLASLEHGMVQMRKDFWLLACLYLAQFIVWRELRRLREAKPMMKVRLPLE